MLLGISGAELCVLQLHAVLLGMFERVKGPYCWDVDGNK